MSEKILGSRHHGYLGTAIEFHIRAEDEAGAELAERRMLDEIERLQSLFNVHDPDSALCLWSAGQTRLDPAILEAWEAAEGWLRRSHGAFSPTAGHARKLWESAETSGRLPSEEELSAAVHVAQTSYVSESRLDEARFALDLNAIAKGWIVDQVADAGMATGSIHGLTINAGGDLLHKSGHPVVVGIEDPARPYDNVPPLTRVELADGALATSGGARRYWTIAGDRYSHVLDPRTGMPVTRIAQASVIAPNASTADAIATTLTVVQADEAKDFLGPLDDVGVLIIDIDGSIRQNQVWAEAEVN